MTARRGLALAAAAALALGLAAAPCHAATAPPGAEAAEDAARQILVMLRMPPQHARPGAAYGGSYGDGEARSARVRTANRLAQAYGVSVVSQWPMPLLGVHCFVMAVPSGLSPQEVAERLSRDPAVSWSEPVHLYRGRSEAAAHNDPLFRTQPAAGGWRLAELHELATGRNVRVAVIDSGVDRAHPDLAGQVEVSENFLGDRSPGAEQHGTAVAGVIAARADNGLGIAGVAPGARLLALRACRPEAARPGVTVCDSLSLAKALDFAIQRNAQVINLSLSGPPDQLLGRLLDIAVSRGAVVVGAYDRSLRGGGFPASHRGVVAVADEAAGPPVAGVFTAPGRDVPTTHPGGRWGMVDGSSYAAAHVSGLMALLRERVPARRPFAGGAAALVIARPSDTIDACATLLQTTGPCDCSCGRPKEILAAFPK